MSAATIGELSPTGTLSPSLPLSRRKRAMIPVTPMIPVPASRPSSKRRKAKGDVAPIACLSSAAPISEDQVGHGIPVTHAVPVDLILHIRETHRRRQDFHRAEKSLTNQIKAIERRLTKAGGQSTNDTHTIRAASPSPLNGGAGDQRITDTLRLGVSGDCPLSCEEQDEGHLADDTHGRDADVLLFATLPLAEARAGLKKHRLSVERDLAKLAKQLPVWSWVEAINGFGAIGLAQIVGEAGDLSNYSNPAKLWKRMGLAVFGGKSQRRVAGAGAIEQGYSPIRRAVMFCIGDSLLKKQNAYRELYLARKVTEQSKVPDGTKMLWHRRAQRYAEKRLLRDLWRAWKATD